MPSFRGGGSASKYKDKRGASFVAPVDHETVIYDQAVMEKEFEELWGKQISSADKESVTRFEEVKNQARVNFLEEKNKRAKESFLSDNAPPTSDSTIPPSYEESQKIFNNALRLAEVQVEHQRLQEHNESLNVQVYQLTTDVVNLRDINVQLRSADENDLDGIDEARKAEQEALEKASDAEKQVDALKLAQMESAGRLEELRVENAGLRSSLSSKIAASANSPDTESREDNPEVIDNLRRKIAELTSEKKSLEDKQEENQDAIEALQAENTELQTLNDQIESSFQYLVMEATRDLQDELGEARSQLYSKTGKVPQKKPELTTKESKGPATEARDYDAETKKIQEAHDAQIAVLKAENARLAASAKDLTDQLGGIKEAMKASEERAKAAENDASAAKSQSSKDKARADAANKKAAEEKAKGDSANKARLAAENAKNKALVGSKKDNADKIKAEERARAANEAKTKAEADALTARLDAEKQKYNAQSAQWRLDQENKSLRQKLNDLSTEVNALKGDVAKANDRADAANEARIAAERDATAAKSQSNQDKERVAEEKAKADAANKRAAEEKVKADAADEARLAAETEKNKALAYSKKDNADKIKAEERARAANEAKTKAEADALAARKEMKDANADVERARADMLALRGQYSKLEDAFADLKENYVPEKDHVTKEEYLLLKEQLDKSDEEASKRDGKSRQDIFGLQQENERLSDLFAIASQNNEELRAQVGQLTEDKRRLEIQNQAKAKKIRDLERQITDKEREHESSKDSEKSKMQGEIDELRRQVADLQAIGLINDRLLKEIEAGESMLTDLQEKYNESQEEIRGLCKELSDKTEEVIELQKALEELLEMLEEQDRDKDSDSPKDGFGGESLAGLFDEGTPSPEELKARLELTRTELRQARDVMANIKVELNLALGITNDLYGGIPIVGERVEPDYAAPDDGSDTEYEDAVDRSNEIESDDGGYLDAEPDEHESDNEGYLDVNPYFDVEPDESEVESDSDLVAEPDVNKDERAGLVTNPVYEEGVSGSDTEFTDLDESEVEPGLVSEPDKRKVYRKRKEGTDVETEGDWYKKPRRSGPRKRWGNKALSVESDSEAEGYEGSARRSKGSGSEEKLPPLSNDDSAYPHTEPDGYVTIDGGEVDSGDETDAKDPNGGYLDIVGDSGAETGDEGIPSSDSVKLTTQETATSDGLNLVKSEEAQSRFTVTDVGDIAEPELIPTTPPAKASETPTQTGVATAETGTDPIDTDENEGVPVNKLNITDPIDTIAKEMAAEALKSRPKTVLTQNEFAYPVGRGLTLPGDQRIGVKRTADDDIEGQPSAKKGKVGGYGHDDEYMNVGGDGTDSEYMDIDPSGNQKRGTKRTADDTEGRPFAKKGKVGESDYMDVGGNSSGDETENEEERSRETYDGFGGDRESDYINVDGGGADAATFDVRGNTVDDPDDGYLTVGSEEDSEPDSVKLTAQETTTSDGPDPAKSEEAQSRFTVTAVGDIAEPELIPTTPSAKTSETSIQAGVATAETDTDPIDPDENVGVPVNKLNITDPIDPIAKEMAAEALKSRPEVSLTQYESASQVDRGLALPGNQRIGVKRTADDIEGQSSAKKGKVGESDYMDVDGNSPGGGYMDVGGNSSGDETENEEERSRETYDGFGGDSEGDYINVDGGGADAATFDVRGNTVDDPDDGYLTVGSEEDSGSDSVELTTQEIATSDGLNSAKPKEEHQAQVDQVEGNDNEETFGFGDLEEGGNETDIEEGQESDNENGDLTEDVLTPPSPVYPDGFGTPPPIKQPIAESQVFIPPAIVDQPSVDESDNPKAVDVPGEDDMHRPDNNDDGRAAVTSDVDKTDPFENAPLAPVQVNKARADTFRGRDPEAIASPTTTTVEEFPDAVPGPDGSLPEEDTTDDNYMDVDPAAVTSDVDKTDPFENVPPAPVQVNKAIAATLRDQDPEAIAPPTTTTVEEFPDAVSRPDGSLPEADTTDDGYIDVDPADNPTETNSSKPGGDVLTPSSPTNPEIESEVTTDKDNADVTTPSLSPTVTVTPTLPKPQSQSSSQGLTTVHQAIKDAATSLFASDREKWHNSSNPHPDYANRGSFDEPTKIAGEERSVMNCLLKYFSGKDMAGKSAPSYLGGDGYKSSAANMRAMVEFAEKLGCDMDGLKDSAQDVKGLNDRSLRDKADRAVDLVKVKLSEMGVGDLGSGLKTIAAMTEYRKPTGIVRDANANGVAIKASTMTANV